MTDIIKLPVALDELEESFEALLRVVRAAQVVEKRLVLIQKLGPLGDSPKWTKDLTEALEALPPHLKERI